MTAIITAAIPDLGTLRDVAVVWEEAVLDGWREFREEYEA